MDFKNSYLMKGQPHDKSPLGYPAWIWTNIPTEFVKKLENRLDQLGCHGIYSGDWKATPGSKNVYFWASPRIKKEKLNIF